MSLPYRDTRSVAALQSGQVHPAFKESRLHALSRHLAGILAATIGLCSVVGIMALLVFPALTKPATTPSGTVQLATVPPADPPARPYRLTDANISPAVPTQDSFVAYSQTTSTTPGALAQLQQPRRTPPRISNSSTSGTYRQPPSQPRKPATSQRTPPQAAQPKHPSQPVISQAGNFKDYKQKFLGAWKDNDSYSNMLIDLRIDGTFTLKYNTDDTKVGRWYERNSYHATLSLKEFLGSEGSVKVDPDTGSTVVYLPRYGTYKVR
jgi:hypothetical protein